MGKYAGEAADNRHRRLLFKYVTLHVCGSFLSLFSYSGVCIHVRTPSKEAFCGSVIETDA